MDQKGIQKELDTKSKEIDNAMENGPYTIVVDLDGTLAEFDHWRGYDHIGDPILKTEKYLRSAKINLKPVKIILHTCRVTTLDNKIHEASLRRIRSWLVDNVMVSIIDEIWMNTGKPYGDVYLDDKAINVRDI